MNKVFILVSFLVLHSCLSDINARGRHQRYPRKLVKRKEEPQRRTFITALLAAEIEFLEGLLEEQNGARRPVQQSSAPGGQHPKHHHKHKQPAPPQQAVKSEKYVSKLDPFHMIAAPDLTKESIEVATPNDYEAPKETTTKKYGELEHYNLKGYLPPVKEEYQAPTTTAAPPTTAPPAPTYSAPSNTYTVVKTPPAPAPAYNTQQFSYEAPVPAPAYEAPPAPAPAYSAPPAPVPAYSAPVAAPAYEAPAPAPDYPAPETKLVLVPGPAPAPANNHPLTFFHEAQAGKVHEGGEWPTVYYNTFDGSKKTLIL